MITVAENSGDAECAPPGLNVNRSQHSQISLPPTQVYPSRQLCLRRYFREPRKLEFQRRVELLCHRYKVIVKFQREYNVEALAVYKMKT